MASRDTKVNNGLSLKSLAADLLNVCLDKSLELRCSDWEADQLSPEQVLRPKKENRKSASELLAGLIQSTRFPPSR